MSLLLLVMQIGRVGVDNIGAVTMFVLGVCSILFYGDVDEMLPFSTRLHDVCLGAGSVWFGGEWYRVLTHGLFHVTGMHLYFNMSSLLLKGRLLEPVLGTIPFAWLVFSFLLCTGLLMTFVSVILDPFLPNMHLLSTCAVGFSSVLFALNTALPHVLQQPHQSFVMGFQVPTKYLTLIELALVSLLVPQASFLGHLCGIVVGYAFVTRKFDFIFRMPELLLLNHPQAAAAAAEPRAQQANRAGNNNAGGLYVDQDGVLRRR